MSQPWLHDLVLCLAAPTQVWSAPDGQLRAAAPNGPGLAGAYHDDRRLLSELVVLVDGAAPVPLAEYDEGGDVHVFVAGPRGLGDPGPDPTVRLVRRREVEPGLLREQYVVTSTASVPVSCELGLRIASDRQALHLVKEGQPSAAVPPQGVGGPTLTWDDHGSRVVLRLHGARTCFAGAAGDPGTGDTVLATWPLTVPPGASVVRELLLTVDDPRSAVVGPPRAADWSPLHVTSADRRLGPVVDRCLQDLRLLRLAMPGSDEEFLGAGAPWFLTLFGRDSLWAARMLLPVTTGLAGSTLRVLAARQGARVDHATAEEPGKILHEVRSGPLWFDDREGVRRELPSTYYGTIDATPLWALTLVDAAAWGLPADEVERLLPALEAALTWQVEHGDADGDHLLEYVDHTGRGLANQGWKDSGDAVRRSDGSLAAAPLALSEVQGYAYAAAVRGADLLEAHGRPGTDRWRTWAQGLRASFRRSFWVEDVRGRFPAIALDREKRPVVSLASNMGHLLGTGLLDEPEVAAVAERLASADLLSGFGIRTLSREAAGYSPTGYHVGSVWPHDTAICLMGLAAEGRPETAPVGEALLTALHTFGGRPPELFAGDARADHPVPLPYPAACRPQAWSAAAAVSMLTSLTGLRPPTDPGGSPIATPVRPWDYGRTELSGWRVGGTAYRLAVDASGESQVSADG